MKNYKIFFVTLLSSCYSLSAMQSARFLRPAMRPAALYGRITPSRAMATLPTITTYRQQEEHRSGGRSYYSRFFQVPFYAAVGATLGAAYIDAKKEKQLAELEKKIELLDKRLRVRKALEEWLYYPSVIEHYEQSLSNTKYWVTDIGFFIHLIGKAQESKLSIEDFLNIIDFLRITEPEKFDEFITKWPDTLSRAFGYFADESSDRKQLEEWFLKNPLFFKEFLQKLDKKGHLGVNFFNPAFIEVFNTWIKDRRHRAFTAGIIKKYLVISKNDKKYFHPVVYKFPNILKWLQQDELHSISDALLAKLGSKELPLKTRLEKLEQHSKDSVLVISKHLSLFKEKYPEKIDTILKSKSIYQFIDAMDKASELNNKGYISFFHGQQPEFGLINDIGTELLYRLANEKKPDDFYFLRFRSQDFEKIVQQNKQKIVARILNEQQDLMKDWGQSGVGENFMALNLFPFGNSGFSGESTYFYVENKYNETVVLRSMEYFPILSQELKRLGLKDPEISALESKSQRILKMADETYRTGRLVLVALPYNIVSQAVFPVSSKIDKNAKYDESFIYGNKHSIYGRNIDELVEVLGMQEYQPTFEGLDTFHCVMPLTPAEVLNPESGIKIFNFDNPVSPQAEQEFKKAKQEFIDEVMRLLKESGQLEKSEKIARDYLQLLHDVHIAEENRLTGVSKAS